MALRDQPYLPLYVQDFLTDEKLIECSASATGVYIRVMCIMHKSDPYGMILLKQKDKQTDKQIKNFALKIAKQMPYSVEIVESSIEELVSEKVLHIDGDYLVQKRMVRDCEISLKRASAGSEGGKKTMQFASEFAQAKVKANTQANSDNDNDIVIDNENDKEVEEIYLLYPTTDKNKDNQSTGKTSKNKQKIKKILESKYPLKKAIEFYLSECNRTKCYLKNFGTFLNNLPDESTLDVKQQSEVVITGVTQESMDIMAQFFDRKKKVNEWES